MIGPETRSLFASPGLSVRCFAAKSYRKKARDTPNVAGSAPLLASPLPPDGVSANAAAFCFLTSSGLSSSGEF